MNIITSRPTYLEVKSLMSAAQVERLEVYNIASRIVDLSTRKTIAHIGATTVVIPLAVRGVEKSTGYPYEYVISPLLTSVLCVYAGPKIADIIYKTFLEKQPEGHE